MLASKLKLLWFLTDVHGMCTHLGSLTQNPLCNDQASKLPARIMLLLQKCQFIATRVLLSCLLTAYLQHF